jgi:hypothetical protein
MDDELKIKIEKSLIENATTYYLKRYVKQYNIINLKLLIKKALEFNNAELYYNILENLQLYNSLDEGDKKEVIFCEKFDEEGNVKDEYLKINR